MSATQRRPAPAPDVVVARDGVVLPLPAPRVRRIVRTVLARERRVASISVTFVGPAAMRRLNAKWKGHDAATDVLSFAWPSPAGGLTGDVYICAAVGRSQARRHGAPVPGELTRLVVHGTLHVLGHDHPEGPGRTRSEMWRRQERYVKALT